MPGSYNPIEYWNERQKPNSSEWLTAQEYGWLRRAIHPGDSVLDIGPGMGRCFPAYMESSAVYGIDITDRYQDKAQKQANIYSLNYTQIIVNSPEEIRTYTPRCDVGIAVKMLQHVPYAEVDGWMDALCECDRIALIHDLSLLRPKHMFNHQYIDLLLDRDRTIEAYEVQENLRIFVSAS